MNRLSSWTDTYRSKVVTADKALSEVRSGQRVYIHPGAAEPERLVRALRTASWS
jgi:acyl-CoA hydrolase